MSESDKIDLYYYTHLEDESGCDHVMKLMEGSLRLLDPLKVNDPFDSALKLNHDDLTEVEARRRLSHSGGIFDRLVAINGSSEDCVKKVVNDRETKAREYRIFCTSEKWDSGLMWSHYSRSHKGICIKLNLTPSCLPDGHKLKPVRYTTYCPELKAKDVESNSPDSLETLLLTKSVDWLYEKEWRYIAPSKDCKAGCVDCKKWLNVDAVYMGVRFDELAMRNFLDSFFLHKAEADFTGNNRNEFYCDHREKILCWIAGKNQEKLEEVFGKTGAVERFKSLDAREKVLTKLKESKIPLRKCQKRGNRFELELHDFEYEPLQSRS